MCVPSEGFPCFSEKNSITLFLESSRPWFSSQPKISLHSQVIIIFPERIQRGLPSQHIFLFCLFTVFSLLIYTKSLQAMAIWLVFVNIFLEHSHAHSSHTISGSICVKQQSWAHWDRQKAQKVYYLALYKKGLPTSGLDHKILTCSACHFMYISLSPWSFCPPWRLEP